jgi:hypothetical protein
VGYTLGYIKPDLLVEALVLVQAGLFVRLKRAKTADWRLAAGFGVALGLGYLTKAILFPVAFLFLGLPLVAGKSRQAWKMLALSGLVFIAISAPEIAALSLAKGRLTYADSGRLNIAWHNYGIPYRDWQGGRGSGTALHPTRKIYDHPAVYEFNGPVRASYPPWFDASYWNEGLAPPFNLAIMVRHAEHNAAILLLLLAQPKAWSIAMLLLLLGASAASLRGMAEHWDLILIAVLVFALYCLTTVEARYFPPWQLLFWGAILSGFRLRPRFCEWAGYRWLAGLTAAFLVFSMANGMRGQFRQGQHDDGSPDYLTAEGLIQMGVRPGTKVAAIGFDNDAYFAYLDRLGIVAEINTDDACEFWQSSPLVQTEILTRLRNAGAELVVANTGGGVRSTSRAPALDIVHCARPGDGWRKIGDSVNRAYFLR